MRRLIFIMTMFALLFNTTGRAQPNRLVSEGNKLYQEKKYKEASSVYQKALAKNPNYTPGMFNLGNALYQQKQYDGARKVMDNAAKLDTNKLGKAAANYNIGNTYMAEKKWEEAIDAYKKALRTNPQDAEAKYNLSYAQQMLKKQGGGGKNDKNNKDDKKEDKNNDKQKKEDEKKNDDKKDGENKDQQNNDDKKDKQQENKPQPQQSKLSEKQAEQLLNALQQEEKKLQDKHKKVKGVPVKVDKDW